LTTSEKGRIFISYRRADSAGYAGRIYDRLTAHFGVDAIFMDVDTIEAGLDFVKVLQNAVQSCDVLVALIGRRWLDIKDETGKRRLDEPEDFVRIEIAAALERDIRVIPVLVDGVNMPYSTELPENLKPLARRNAFQVDHHSFNADARRLISQLELALKAAEDSRVLKVQKLREEKERKEKEAAAKALREKAEREAIEKARKKTHDKAEAEERARLAAEQKARDEREEKTRKEKKALEKVEERARIIVLRKIRLQETAERIRNVFGDRGRRPFFIGGGVVLLFLLGYLIKDSLALIVPASALETTATFAVGSATVTRTEIPSTPTSTSTQTPTNIPSSPTPTPGVGSMMISEKDGMRMVYVPAGEFLMGSDADDILAECRKYIENCQRGWFTGEFSDEEPIHNVDLNAFWIDQTEVSNAMYAKCVEAGACDPPRLTESNTRDNYFGNPEFDDYPVIHVSWYHSNAYCEWANRRLPTDAEWEKAAGWDEEAQAHRVYPWGNDFDGAKVNSCDINCSYEWKNSEFDDNYAETAPVGSYPEGSSFYGVYNMAGNVWEWVSDWYDSEYYANSPFLNPTGPDSGTSRLVRGGAWDLRAIFVRSAVRVPGNPTSSGDLIGFRCARDAE